MPNLYQSVFISYRRSANRLIAHAIFKDLLAHGYSPDDIFMDDEKIDSGFLEPAVLNQIAAHAHFVIILTAGAVERCNEIGDWLSLEIECALELERNIIPLMVRDFVFEGMDSYLPGGLRNLRLYPSIRMFHEHLEEALPLLRQQLATPVAHRIDISPTPIEDRALVQRKIERLSRMSAPTFKQLRAEAYVDRAATHRQMRDWDEAISNYNKALQLDPQYAFAYLLRGTCYYFKDDMQPALDDYARALRCDPELVGVYNARAVLYDAIGAYDQSITDYSEAIRLRPNYDMPYTNRGELYFVIGDYAAAWTDFVRGNELKPGFPAAVAGLAITCYVMGKTEEAKRNWRMLLQMDKRYRDPLWVQRRLLWDKRLVEEARRLIDAL